MVEGCAPLAHRIVDGIEDFRSTAFGDVDTGLVRVLVVLVDEVVRIAEGVRLR